MNMFWSDLDSGWFFEDRIRIRVNYSRIRNPGMEVTEAYYYKEPDRWANRAAYPVPS